MTADDPSSVLPACRVPLEVESIPACSLARRVLSPGPLDPASARHGTKPQLHTGGQQVLPRRKPTTHTTHPRVRAARWLLHLRWDESALVCS